MKLVINKELKLNYLYSNVMLKYMITDTIPRRRVYGLSFEENGNTVLMNQEAGLEFDIEKIGRKAVDKICQRRGVGISKLDSKEIKSIELVIFHVYESDRGPMPLKSKHIITRPETGRWW